MKFTDKYVKLPIKVFNTEQKELTGNAELFDSNMYILPSEISNYKITEDDEDELREIVHLKLKNGDSFYVYLTLKQFCETLDKHQERLLCRID